MSGGSTAGSDPAGALSRRPGAGDYPNDYGRYVEKVPDGPVLETLAGGVARTRSLLEGLGPEDETHRYAPEKWSVREVVGHVADTERLFSFRAVHMARSDPAELPSMDQEVWARASNAHERPLSELLDELDAVRRSTLRLFRGLSPEALERRGVASGFEFVVKGIPWIAAGHEIHHRRILRERYRSGAGGGA